MELIPGFKWAVTEAFTDALSLCRFGEGDILYDSKKAYNESWQNRHKHITYYLQVRYPARGLAVKIKGKSGVFYKNWDSEVRIELYEKDKKIEGGQIETTQGRLYTLLWKGDIQVLEMQSSPPDKPFLLNYVSKKVNEAQAAASEMCVNGSPVFIMARDRTIESSRTKHLSVKSKLQKFLHQSPVYLSPQEAGLVEANKLAPTIDIAFYLTNNINANELHELVKSAVYNPSITAKKHRFNLSLHGLIVDAK